MDVLQLTAVFEISVETFILNYGINLCILSLPGYKRISDLKLTYIKLNFQKETKLVFLLENKIRGGVFSVMGDRFVGSNTNKESLHRCKFCIRMVHESIISYWSVPKFFFFEFLHKQKLSSRRFVLFSRQQGL